MFALPFFKSYHNILLQKHFKKDALNPERKLRLLPMTKYIYFFQHPIVEYAIVNNDTPGYYKHCFSKHFKNW